MNIFRRMYAAAEYAIGNAGQGIERENALHRAKEFSPIAIAEQMKRLADAAERQAAAVEKRNKLLAEYNDLMAKDLDRMSEQRERLLDIFAGNDNDLSPVD